MGKNKKFLRELSDTRIFAPLRPIAPQRPNTGSLFCYTRKPIMTETKTVGSKMRPRFEDRGKVKQRVNVSLSKAAKKKAMEIGDGNVSRGIEMAVNQYQLATDTTFQNGNNWGENR